MSATPFKVVSWSPNDAITSDKLNAMVSNDNWIKTNSVRGTYRGHGKRFEEGVKIAAGLTLITSRSEHWARKEVNFGGIFTPGCKPIVTTGIVSSNQHKVFCTIEGTGGDLHPSREGFVAHVVIDANAKKDKKIKKNLYVSWHALGY